MQVSQKQFDDNWQRAFGKYPDLHVVDCNTTPTAAQREQLRQVAKDIPGDVATISLSPEEAAGLIPLPSGDGLATGPFEIKFRRCDSLPPGIAILQGDNGSQVTIENIGE
jgi:hypothetical protein